MCIHQRVLRTNGYRITINYVSDRIIGYRYGRGVFPHCNSINIRCDSNRFTCFLLCNFYAIHCSFAYTNAPIVKNFSIGSDDCAKIFVGIQGVICSVFNIVSIARTLTFSYAVRNIISRQVISPSYSKFVAFDCRIGIDYYLVSFCFFHITCRNVKPSISRNGFALFPFFAVILIYVNVTTVVIYT